MRSMAYFPLFGTLIGVWGAVFFNAAAVLWPSPIAAAISTLATVWLTGGVRSVVLHTWRQAWDPGGISVECLRRCLAAGLLHMHWVAA